MPDLTPNYKFKKPIFAEETADIRVINENFDIADEELKKANDTIKNLGNDKQNKTDNNLKTDSDEIVPAINESLWRHIPKEIGNTTSETDIFEVIKTYPLGDYQSRSSRNIWKNLPDPVGGYFNKAFNLRITSVNDTTGKASNYRTAVICEYLGNNSRGGRIYIIEYSVEIQTNGGFVGGWREILTSSSLLYTGILGIDSLRLIQESGTKTKDNIYIDKTTGKAYIAKETNTDTSVTAKFKLATNQELAKENTTILTEKTPTDSNKFSTGSTTFIAKKGDTVIIDFETEKTSGQISKTYYLSDFNFTGYTLRQFITVRATTGSTASGETIGSLLISRSEFRIDKTTSPSRSAYVTVIATI